MKLNKYLIFVGNYDSTLFNDTFCSKIISKNNFFKLDEINIRENLIIMNISFHCVNNINNYLSIYIIIERNGQIIIYVGIKKVNIDVIYNDYKINDFPFWLCLYNKKNFDMRNITSDYLMSFL